MNDRKRAELFDRMYNRLPKIECKGLCYEACGPIAASMFEFKRAEKAAGKDLAIDGDMTCSLLTSDKRCSVYADRPLVCRLFGVVKRMQCPHGCLPTRFLPDQEVQLLLNNATKLGGITVTSRLPDDYRDRTQRDGASDAEHPNPNGSGQGPERSTPPGDA